MYGGDNRSREHSSFNRVLKCPVCDEAFQLEERFPLHYFSDEVVKLSAINTIPEIKLLHCRTCSHSFSSYTIIPEVLDNYYSKISSVIYKNCTVQSIDTHDKERKKQAEEIERCYPSGGKILDVGCGNGFLLNCLNKERWVCFGVEPSASMCEIASKSGINILGQYITQVPSSIFSFDVIILFDVIEHISQPQQMMQQVYSLLKSDGKVIIITANIDSINARLVGPMWSYFNSYQHISFFSNASLRYLLSETNFTNIRVKRISYELGLIKNLYGLLKNLIRFILFILKIRKRPVSPLAFDHILVFATK